LHDAHIRFGLRLGTDVICEKPLVLHPRNIEGLIAMEEETGKKAYTLLQLRHHPSILEYRDRVDVRHSGRKKVNLTYITPRGKWYQYSWKGDADKSGGIVTNIGYHFFDLLIWLFGSVESHEAEHLSPSRAGGILQLEHAEVKWRLSIEGEDLPPGCKNSFRSLKIDGEEIDLDTGFADLHAISYQGILGGNGIRPAELLEVTTLVHEIRQGMVGSGELEA
jgi:UDP-N-acetyl-2-amino-2-deoxyglucuronate dehydrogenase